MGLTVVQTLEQLIDAHMASSIFQDTLMKALMFSAIKEVAGPWLI